MTVTTLPTISSIQGEQQPESRYVPASQDDVDEYVEGASDGVLDCRQGRRHPFPPFRKNELHFTAVDEDDNFVRQIECPSCQCATRIEKWAWIGGPKTGRMEFVDSHIDYHPNRHTGEVYLAKPGTGRYTPRAVKNSMATMAMKGQSVAALKKALKRAKEQ